MLTVYGGICVLSIHPYSENTRGDLNKIILSLTKSDVLYFITVSLYNQKGSTVNESIYSLTYCIVLKLFAAKSPGHTLWSGGSLGFNKVAIKTWIFLEALMASNPGLQMGPNLSKILVEITLNT